MSICLITIPPAAFSQSIVSQQGISSCAPKLHRIQLGLKVGTPGICTAGVEFVSPLLRNRVAPFVEASRLKMKYNETSLNSRFLEYGINLYFSELGRKGYLAVSRSRLSLEGRTQNTDGITEVHSSFQGTNIKLGGRWGKRIYFRMEAGFTFGRVPEGLELIEYEAEGNISKEFEAFPETVTTYTQMGLPVFNIGMGVSL